MKRSAFEQALTNNKIVRYKDSFERVVVSYDKLSGRMQLIDTLESIVTTLHQMKRDETITGIAFLKSVNVFIVLG